MIKTTIMLLAICAIPMRAHASEMRAADYGLKADGVTDDGPAIERMLVAAAGAKGPVRLLFPPKKQIRVTSARERYVFRFDGAADLTVDGRGSTFVLGADVRFLRLSNSHHVTLRRLNIDFAPLPFVDGTVVAVDPGRRFLEVAVKADEATRLVGGPTKQDGEQAFFGMLWYRGPYGLLSRHYFIERTEPAPEPGRVRVFAQPGFSEFGDIRPGLWRISLPVPGIAHRYGPGACLEIADNDTVTLEDIELWSASWIGVYLLRNRGRVTFRHVNIRPKPGSGRLTSTWRDGFHVKGNSGTLLWEDCVLSGMNDDAFNISTHCSRVRRVLSPTRVEVLQVFPLAPMPWHVGNTLTAADTDAAALLGRARITQVVGWTTERRVDGFPAASPVVLEFDRPIAGLAVGSMVWEPEWANPDTTLRRCTIRMSCRLQSPVKLDNCDVAALLWFYHEELEGPYPSSVVVRDCRLRRGRGNPRLAVAFAGSDRRDRGPSAIHDVVFERNRVWGDLSVVGVDRLRLGGNSFLAQGAAMRIENCTDEAGKPLREPR